MPAIKHPANGIVVEGRSYRVPDEPCLPGGNAEMKFSSAYRAVFTADRYPALMRLPLTFASAFLLLIMAGQARAAATVDKVVVTGLDDELMQLNVELALSLNNETGKRLGESRLEFLLREAVAETREALEPFGYYSPEITVDAPRRGGNDDRLSVTVHVVLGDPVRIRESNLSMEGEAEQDPYLQEDVEAFRPQVGDVLNHTLYEASKTRIMRRLAERGYLDADAIEHRVEVTRADHAADIFLTWASGIRYNMGPTEFHQDYFNPGLLDKLVSWEQGSYFHQGKLDRLRESLVALDYFSLIDIRPDPDRAVDGEVPIDVQLALAPRSIYTVGLRYGTDTGTGVRLGLERRYVNRRGHKLLTELDWANRRKTFTTIYRVPAFLWLDGWYTAAAQGLDEQTDYIDIRNLQLIASRSGEINEHWRVVASLNFLRERWNYGAEDFTGEKIYQYATLTYPELRGEYFGVDDRLFPRRGVSGQVSLRGGVEGAGSDASFSQLHSQVRWFLSPGANNRLLLRGEAGTSFTGDLFSMPPSLRYFAGGDRSIRGYGLREVGPRTVEDYAVGAKHVLTGSVEFERYMPGSDLFGGQWGVAGFVDTGSAFDSTPDWHTGVGIGFRWKSPVGPVRIDIARGLNDPDSAFQLYLNIGSDL